MIPGAFLFDDNFKFRDGKTGRKIFVILNNGVLGSYIAVKTTSKGDRYGIQYGCQIMDRFPNFHFVNTSCFLHENTWIQLDDFFEFDAQKLLQKITNGEVRKLFVLDSSQTIELLTCASHSDDISVIHETEIKKTIDAIRNQLSA
jgi:hypothetical protein